MATALIQFTQSANTTPAGTAALSTSFADFSVVTVENGANTGVVSWKIYLLDAPVDSSTYPDGSQPQILAQAVDNTPIATFTPDVLGTYRIMLEVTDSLGNIDRDIRCFALPDIMGFIKPPYQQNPEPLPQALPGIITRDPRPVKPDELNYSTNIRGWSGGGGTGSLDFFFLTHRDLLPQIVTTTPYDATIIDGHVHIVDLTTIAGDAVFNLPVDPRVGFVSRIAVQGTGFTVTIQGGTISGQSSVVLTAGGITLVHQGFNVWSILDLVGGALTALNRVWYVDSATTVVGGDGNIETPFATVAEAVTAEEADPGFFNVLLLQGSFTEDPVFTAGIRIAPVAPNEQYEINGNPDFAGAAIFDVWGMYDTNVIHTVSVSSASGTLRAARCDFNALSGAGSAELTDTRIGSGGISLNVVNLTRCLVFGAVSVGSGPLNDAWKDTSLGGTVTITAGDLAASRCTFANDISVTGNLRLEHCTVAGAATITCGVLSVDSVTYQQLIDDGVTLTVTSIHVLGTPTAQQTLGWDASAPQVHTVLLAGHVAGVYLVCGLANVTTPADTGTINRTIDGVSSPNESATVTDTYFRDPITVVSDGTLAVTVTYNSSSITGAPAIDLYSGATLVSNLV